MKGANDNKNVEGWWRMTANYLDNKRRTIAMNDNNDDEVQQFMMKTYDGD